MWKSIAPLKKKIVKRKGKKEPDYEKMIKSFMIQKYLALASMDYMDEESDSIKDKTTVDKITIKKKKMLSRRRRSYFKDEKEIPPFPIDESSRCCLKTRSSNSVSQFSFSNDVCCNILTIPNKNGKIIIPKINVSSTFPQLIKKEKEIEESPIVNKSKKTKKEK